MTFSHFCKKFPAAISFYFLVAASGRGRSNKLHPVPSINCNKVGVRQKAICSDTVPVYNAAAAESHDIEFDIVRFIGDRTDGVQGGLPGCDRCNQAA